MSAPALWTKHRPLALMLARDYHLPKHERRRMTPSPFRPLRRLAHLAYTLGWKLAERLERRRNA